MKARRMAESSGIVPPETGEASTGRAHLLIGLAAASLVVALLMPPWMARSAEPYKVGDSVEVFYLSRWFPAVVAGTNPRGQVLAEFEFAGQPRREIFNKNGVIFAYEAGALCRSRKWSDASGSFSIEAALTGIEGDSVTLRKADMSEIKVPVSKLSDADQRFVKTLEKNAGPAAQRPPEPPPLEEFAGDSGFESWGVSLNGDEKDQRSALPPDPAPAYLKLMQGGVAFPLNDFFDEMGAVLTVGGADGWLLAAVESDRPGDPLPTRLLWASLARKRIEGRQLLPPAEVVLDYHAPSHRLLTYGWLKGPGMDKLAMSLWEVLPTDKQVKPVVRWNTQVDWGGRSGPWGRLVDGDRVVQRTADREIILWDVKDKTIRYRTTQESFFAPEPTLSGGHKYLFIPEDKQVRILESATGRLLSTLGAEDGAAAVGISDDGMQAAVLGHSTLTVWDLADPAVPPRRYQAESVGTPFAATLSWVGTRRVLVDYGAFNPILFDLDRELALWSYEFDSMTVNESHGERRLREIVDGHLVYTASVSSGREEGAAVGAVRLPGPKVEQVAASLDREAMMIIKPGTAMKLDVRAGDNNARVQAALEQKIRANGWVLSPDAPMVMTAEMTRGKTQQVKYRPWGITQSDREETASVTPYISSVKIEVGGKVAWQSSTSSGPPMVVSMRKGQSVQSEIDRWQRPNVEFFSTVTIPASILDPAKRTGLGVTVVSNRGLIPQ